VDIIKTYYCLWGSGAVPQVSGDECPKVFVDDF